MILVLLYALGMVLLSGRMYMGNAFYEAARSIGDPAESFAHYLIAYRKWPYDYKIRLMVFNSLMRWVDTQTNAEFNPKSVDRAYEVTRSASPYDPAVLVLRVSYLINSGRYKSHHEEIERALAQLRKSASLQTETWITEASWASRLGQGERALAALKIATMTRNAYLAKPILDKIGEKNG